MGILVISSATLEPTNEIQEDPFFVPLVKTQIQWCLIGFAVFFLTASFDYNKLREWTWILYPLMIISLFGLFFTNSIQNVNRWYRISAINMSFQPSECAKLIVVIALSWFLERRKPQANSLKTAFLACLIVGIPFLLILKQPDLGTALVLFPITLVMFYFGDIHPKVVKVMTILGGIALIFVAVIFLKIIPYEDMKPYTKYFLKEYQFERLNPNTHHQKAAAIAIALGGVSGAGWRKGEYIGGKWLPAPYTDSVFPSFGEEYGFIGLVLLLSLFYALIYFSFQVSVVAKDDFGRLLSAGITVYLAMHILVNIGMMTGFLPITGVPLVLVSYGGSSLLATMFALGILQSIYSRRFMF
ncbi:Rod shape-determining protein RodA [Candidatus Rubidus massiliensis]|nr:Rod shape-determining protein RodA [Candidatus Rubidus massiliensis]